MTSKILRYLERQSTFHRANREWVSGYCPADSLCLEAANVVDELSVNQRMGFEAVHFGSSFGHRSRHAADVRADIQRGVLRIQQPPDGLGDDEIVDAEGENGRADVIVR